MDRIETIHYINSEPTSAGNQDIADAVDMLLNGALKADQPGAAGVAWLDGEYRGVWIELRVMIKPRPDKQSDKPTK